MATEPSSPALPGRAAEPERPPDPHWRRTVYAVWFAHLLAAAGFSFVMPFLPFFVRELGVTDEGLVATWAGVAMFAAGLSLTIFQPIWGALADRYGRKLMLQRAMFGGAVMIAIMGFSQTVWQLVVFRFLQGALTGTGAACNTLVASVTPRKQLGFSMGLLQTAIIIGNALGPWLGGVAADSYGYRIPFFVCGGLWAVAGFVVLFGARERFVSPGQCANGNHGLRQVFGTGGMTALLAAFFLSAFAVTFVAPIFPLFVESVADTARAATVTGQIMGVGGLAAGLACIVVGRLADRLGHRRVLIVSSAGSAVFGGLHAIVQTVGHLFGLRIGWGLISGGARPAMSAMIGAHVSSDTYGRAFGITTSAMCLGFALGPLAGGLMASSMGLRLPFVVMGVLQLATAVLIGVYVRPKPREDVNEESSDEPIAAK
ncbi:MAG: MFS transporter [Armatimonadota bacterium]|jgi:DHA1 family multidrug resistance protein-like MFS transporter